MKEMKGTTTYRKLPLPQPFANEPIKNQNYLQQGDGEVLIKMAIENLNQVTPPVAPSELTKKEEGKSFLPPQKRKRIFTFDEANSVGFEKVEVNEKVRIRLWEMISIVELKFCQQKLALFENNEHESGPILTRNISTESEKINAGNWQCWSHEEEVFLVGAVLERFFSRGSLSSTKKENNAHKHNCWETIKATYDYCWKKFTARIGQKCPPERSDNALSRHYKVMKERNISKNVVRNNVSFKTYYDEWEMKYNKKYGLLEDSLASQNLMHDENVQNDSLHGGINKKKAKQGAYSRGRWNYQDEVILIGVVLETFFQRGSLSSSHRERMTKESDFWKTLHDIFQKVKMNISPGDREGFHHNKRTPQALARHFKVMKVKLIESKGKLNLKTFYRDWENNYRNIYLRLVNGSEVETKFPMTSHLPLHLYNQQSRRPSNDSIKVQQQVAQPVYEDKLQNLNDKRNYSQNEKVKGSPLSTANAANMLMNLAKLNGTPTSPSTSSSITAGSSPKPGSLFQNRSSNPILNQSFMSLNFLNSLPTPRFGQMPNLKTNTQSHQQQHNTLNTPVAGLDLDKVNEIFSPLGNALTPTAAGNPTTGLRTPRTPMFPPLMSPSPQPIVTQAGNATTYWLPLTLINKQEEQASKSMKELNRHHSSDSKTE